MPIGLFEQKLKLQTSDCVLHLFMDLGLILGKVTFNELISLFSLESNCLMFFRVKLFNVLWGRIV
jgi:hypothetical protein